MGARDPSRRSLLPRRLRESAKVQRLVQDLARLSGSRRGFLAALVFLILLVAAVGLWTTRAVDRSLHESYRTQLETILDADAKALEIWARGELAEVRLQGERAELVRLVEALREALPATGAKSVLARAPAAGQLRDHLARLRDASGYEWCGVIDAGGTILASTRGDEAGSRVPADALAVLAGALVGQTRFTRLPRADPAGGEDGAAGRRWAVALDRLILAITPVREPAGGVLGALVLAIDPTEFSDILSDARFGESGDTYAVDGDGYMVSRSRHETSLRAVGVIPRQEAPDVFYSLPVRDPGVDVRVEGVPDVPIAALPLTRSAASVVAGQAGIDLEGYRDYRGVEVIGAWKWLEDLGVGLVTEVDAGEAFAVLRPLRVSHGVLLGVLGAFTLILLLSVASIRLLALRVRQLGEYTLEASIGEGSVGAVYLARHALLRRPTALKMLRPEAMSPDNLERFEREVQLMSRLRHPNTVQVYDYGRTPEGLFYYAMEYVDGLTLADLIQLEGSLPPARAIFIFQEIAKALEEAHSIGLVHRDLKPLNVMLCSSGIGADLVKVLDFGLVKEIGTPEELQLTSPEIVGGTPPYIAPERLRDPRHLDPRSDLYSLGGLIYNLVSGKPVFEGASAMEVCTQVLEQDPPPLAEIAPGVPAGLADLVMQCLARDPEARPRDAREILDRLDALAVDSHWGTAEARAWWEANAERIRQRSTPRPI